MFILVAVVFSQLEQGGVGHVVFVWISDRDAAQNLWDVKLKQRGDVTGVVAFCFHGAEYQ